MPNLLSLLPGNLAIPRPRLRLDASPLAAIALRHAAKVLPASPFAGILAGHVSLAFGGIEIVEVATLPPGCWELYADGRLVLAGTLAT